MSRSKEIYKVNNHLVVELVSGEIFEGDYVSGNINRVDLKNVTNNSNLHGATLSFHRSEIKRISKHVEKTKKYNEKTLSNESASPIQKCPANTSNVVQRILVDDDEYSRLLELSDDFIYMAVKDNRYFEACKTLVNAETVSVVALGMKEHRITTIQLLVMATWRQIYIFDLDFKKSKVMPYEIREILESKLITKVIHSAAQTVDCLYRNYRVSLENVFDTQVVDLILEKRDTGKNNKKFRSLGECLERHFNFPSCLVKNASEVSCEEWSRIPRSDNLKKYSAQLCAYLFSLYQLMQQSLLKDVYNSIDKVHKLYLVSDEFEYKKKLHLGECTQQMDALIPNLKALSVNGVPNGNKSEMGEGST